MKKLLAICLCMAVPALAQVPQPDGYRDKPYRGTLPAALDGATVVDTETAHDLWEAGDVAFIDVLPQPPRPAKLPEGTIWQERKRDSIPGAMWLPNVGYAELAPAMHDYFRSGLDRATNGNVEHPVVFFCLDECWMSWNAAKRALEYGFTDVRWMPEGTDGWAEAGYDLMRVDPAEGHP